MQRLAGAFDYKGAAATKQRLEELKWQKQQLGSGGT